MTKPYLGTTGARRADKILRILGGSYRYQIVDGETCIIKNLNNDYDIEIKGIRTRSYEMDMTVTLWKIRDNKPDKAVEIISGISNADDLALRAKNLEKQALQGDSKPIS